MKMFGSIAAWAAALAAMSAVEAAKYTVPTKQMCLNRFSHPDKGECSTSESDGAVQVLTATYQTTV